MSDRSDPNEIAYVLSVARDLERYADEALERKSCHGKAADFYGNIHNFFGLPTAIVASISGISAFTRYSIIAGVTAFLVAGVTGAMHFFNPAKKEKLHLDAGNALDTWATKTYGLVQKGRAHLLDASEVDSRREKLMEEREKLLPQCPRIPTRFRSEKLKRAMDPFSPSNNRRD